MEEQFDFASFTIDKISGDGVQEKPLELHLDESSMAIGVGQNLLEEARICWDNLYNFRNRRKNARQYVRGKHFERVIPDPDKPGESIREEDYIYRQGRKPIKINQVRQLMKNLIGQFLENYYRTHAMARKREHAQLAEVITNALMACADHNKLKLLDTRLMEEFLLSGMFVWKQAYGKIPERDTSDVIIDSPNPTRMFFNTDVQDVRGNDIRFIGELHDLPINEVIRAFSKKPGDKEKIMEWYAGLMDRLDFQINQGADYVDNLDFYVPYEHNKCRVVEIWKKKLVEKLWCHDLLKGEQYQHPASTIEEAIELVEQENAMRIQAAAAQGIPEEMVPLIDYEIEEDDVWCYYFLTPEGKILDAGESPYEHQSHPYTIGLYPLIDGEIWGFVEDIIDQQDGVNRYFQMLDFMLGASAKGVLLFPEDMKPDGWDEQDISNEWVRANGVIMVKAGVKHNMKPEQINSNAQSVAGKDLLMFMLSMMKEVSGVTEAIQGQRPASGTPSSLYAQMVNNASLSSRDYFEFFFSKMEDRDMKTIKLMLQFYDGVRYVNTSGQDYENEAYVLDADAIRQQDAQFDIVQNRGANSPAYRMMMDDYLFQFLNGGYIDLPTFMENTSLPFAGKLIEKIKEKQQVLEEQMAQQGIDPAQLQAAGGKNGGVQMAPEAQQLLTQMMGGKPKAGSMTQTRP